MGSSDSASKVYSGTQRRSRRPAKTHFCAHEFSFLTRRNYLSMTFLGACTTRRLPNLRTWSSSRYFPRPTFRTGSVAPSSQRNHTTIYEKLAPKPREAQSEEYVQFINKLTWVLRLHTGRELGLENRKDGFVSLKLLLNHPEFRGTDMPSLQRIMDMDIKHRFVLRYKPTNKDDAWWIRARRWNESYSFLKPIMTGKGPPQSVYRTTVQEFHAHIARNGIPRLHDEFIHLDCSIPTDHYLDDLKPRDHLFIFIDIEKCQQYGMHFFTPAPPPQPLAPPSHLYTKGDEYGYIPPSFFIAADRVLTKKQLIWGDPDPILQEARPLLTKKEEEDQRRTFLKELKFNASGVNRFPREYKRPHPRTLEEAKNIVTT
ncbi:hypothetical protein HYPSUDRAFT_74440 [Hypholoma sublateritium FD-334 SS-4]|uniref:2'-phosphotransferase n=1 Tax=Hypholoma sublateritium (strain FD-334 SS-4) TaxID=945553 RepID=A0A0D2LJR8_HYPSF|nr:hypothetical protein HYPSUDRAFT_74440 [Hypholoma sublateritium FD-334 SS-4]